MPVAELAAMPMYPNQLEQPCSILPDGRTANYRDFIVALGGPSLMEAFKIIPGANSPKCIRGVTELSEQEVADLVCARLPLGRHCVRDDDGFREEDFIRDIREGTERGRVIIAQEVASMRILQENILAGSVYLVFDNRDVCREVKNGNVG